MRKELQRFTTLTREFTAIIDAKGNYREGNEHIKTICLVDVTTNNRIVSNHNWIIKSPEWNGIRVNSKVSFIATVEPYYKLYRGEKVKDYCLTNINSVKII